MFITDNSIMIVTAEPMCNLHCCQTLQTLTIKYQIIRPLPNSTIILQQAHAQQNRKCLIKYSKEQAHCVDSALNNIINIIS